MTKRPLTVLRAYALSAIFGTLGALLTLATIAVLDGMINLIWTQGVGMDTDHPTRTWFIPLIMVLSGLFLIVINRRLKKPIKGLDEIMADLLNGEQANWRLLPRGIAASLVSIGSGASLGPEGPSSVVAAGVTSLIADKSKQDKETSQTMGLASLSGLLGGLLNAPFLPITMLAESAKSKVQDLTQMLTCSMVGAAFGTATFFLLLGKVFAIDLGVPAYTGDSFEGLFQAFLFGIAGAVGAVLVGVVIQKVYRPLRQKLNLLDWQQTLLAAVLVGLMAFWIPETMFSGQYTISHIVEQASTYTALALLVIDIVKLLSTSILLDNGFFGGAIFPAIFAGTAFGLSLAHFVNVPTSLAVPAAITGLLTLLMKRPFSAAILTVAIIGISTTPIVVVATAGAMLVLTLVAEKLEATA